MAVDIAIASGAVFLGGKALELISKAAESYAQKRIERLIEKGLAKKERDALQDAWKETMTHAFGVALDTLAQLLQPLGLKEDELRQRRAEILVFLENAFQSSLVGF